MKGRDYGLPDYNTVREKIGLPPFRTFEDINPKLAKENPMVTNSFIFTLFASNVKS
jgi:dual oxidase